MTALYTIIMNFKWVRTVIIRCCNNSLARIQWWILCHCLILNNNYFILLRTITLNHINQCRIHTWFFKRYSILKLNKFHLLINHPLFLIHLSRTVIKHNHFIIHTAHYQQIYIANRTLLLVILNTKLTNQTAVLPLKAVSPAIKTNLITNLRSNTFHCMINYNEWIQTHLIIQR